MQVLLTYPQDLVLRVAQEVQSYKRKSIFSNKQLKILIITNNRPN